MAKVVLIGLDSSTATQLGRALASGQHDIEFRAQTASVGEIDADIIFAEGAGKRYVPVLTDVRRTKPQMPVVVVSRIPETSDWLDAIEAGATDYCSAPFEPKQMNWLMESALPRQRTIAA